MSNTETIYEYDANGKLIHYRNSYGVEYWREYDSNGKLIHYRNSYGYEYWREYDSNGNEIHYRNSDGFECWRKYDANGNLIHYRNSDGYESWREYDTNGKCTHYRDNNGLEQWWDADGNVIDKPTKKKDNTTMSNDKKYIITNGTFFFNCFDLYNKRTNIHEATKFTLAEAISIKNEWKQKGIYSDYEIHECICYVGEKYVDKRKTLIEDLERAASKQNIYFIQSADIRYTQNIINAAIEYLKEQKD